MKAARKPPAKRAPLQNVRAPRRKRRVVDVQPAQRKMHLSVNSSLDEDLVDMQNKQAASEGTDDFTIQENLSRIANRQRESPGKTVRSSVCTCNETIALLEEQLKSSKARELEARAEVQDLKLQLISKNSEVDLLRRELVLAQKNIQKLEEAPPFGIEQFKDNNDNIEFYTGLPSYNHFLSLLNFLDVGKHGENIIRYEANSCGLRSTENVGRQHKITVENQIFLVLVKLRVGLLHKHLGHLFHISVSTASRIFSTWIDYMFLQLTEMTLWLSRQAVDAAMPPAFRERYASTRVILDATEIRCDVPTSFVTQSQVYSAYKSTHTLKGLVGISPHGVLTFVSELYTGSTSDRECVVQSGFLNMPFDPDDSVMADKGFKIADLLESKNIKLNLPPFLTRGQFTPTEVEETQEIAAIRIHVERKIRKIKGYHIFDHSIPITLVPLVNQMWTVCAILTNFQPPLLRDAE
ncbi:uncharacterized protein LOC144115992 [Amblyomma americanum]